MGIMLNDDNYYGREANLEYMSVSQYKDFAGTFGKRGCEFMAMEKIMGRWEQPMNTAMMIGSYVDAYFDGTLDRFKEKHPEVFRNDGALRADYVKAERIIERIERDKLFMMYMSGEKQVIMEGELFGSKWKIKMDSYLRDQAIVDLKVVKAVRGKDAFQWVRDFGYMYFVLYWGYDIQGAVYQEIVYQNTGKRLPFYIAAATKQDETDIRLIRVEQNYLDEALHLVENNMPRVLSVKRGETVPDWCDVCECCRHNRVLTKPTMLVDILDEI